jgi:hypothetical protein
MFELEDNDNLVQAWAKVFILWVPQWNLDFLISEVVPILMPLTSFKEKITNRLLSGEMLLEIWSIYGEQAFDKEQKLLSLALSVCNDINWKIRKLGANRLKRIIMNSPKLLIENTDIYSDIIKQLTELMSDEENFVKVDAFETILELIKYTKQADFDEYFAPIISEMFEHEVEQHAELLFSMATLCGRLLYELKKNNIHESLTEKIVEFYQSLISHENEEIRRRATYNLPFFFNEFYNDNESESAESTETETKTSISKSQWRKYIDKLAHDSWIEVRIALVGWYHEIWNKVTHNGRPLGFYKKLLYEFMHDNNDHILIIISNNIRTYIDMFKNETMIEDWEDIEVFNEENKDDQNNEKTPKSNVAKLISGSEFSRVKKNSNLQLNKFEENKKKKVGFNKSSTSKQINEDITYELEQILTENNLLVSEEKLCYLSLAKQLIVLDSNLHNKSYLWREQVELLKAIKDSLLEFPIPEFWLLFHETLLEYAKDGIKPIKYISMEIVAIMILYNYDIEEADSIIELIVSEFAEADSSYLKCLFVDYFEIWWVQQYTIANIEDKLFNHIIDISEWDYKSTKLRILKIIPNLKYLLTDSDILEEIQSMLIRFTDDNSHDVEMKTEEIKLNLFKRKKELKSVEGKEEQKQFEEERQKREEIVKNVIRLNKILVEERNKKEEESILLSNAQSKNGIKGKYVFNAKRSSSNQKSRKVK